jgi:hypothetical protein
LRNRLKYYVDADDDDDYVIDAIYRTKAIAVEIARKGS